MSLADASTEQQSELLADAPDSRDTRLDADVVLEEVDSNLSLLDEEAFKNYLRQELADDDDKASVEGEGNLLDADHKKKLLLKKIHFDEKFNQSIKIALLEGKQKVREAIKKEDFPDDLKRVLAKMRVETEVIEAMMASLRKKYCYFSVRDAVDVGLGEALEEHDGVVVDSGGEEVKKDVVDTGEVEAILTEAVETALQEEYEDLDGGDAYVQEIVDVQLEAAFKDSLDEENDDLDESVASADNITNTELEEALESELEDDDEDLDEDDDVDTELEKALKESLEEENEDLTNSEISVEDIDETDFAVALESELEEVNEDLDDSDTSVEDELEAMWKAELIEKDLDIKRLEAEINDMKDKLKELLETEQEEDDDEAEFARIEAEISSIHDELTSALLDMKDIAAVVQRLEIDAKLKETSWDDESIEVDVKEVEDSAELIKTRLTEDDVEDVVKELKDDAELKGASLEKQIDDSDVKNVEADVVNMDSELKETPLDGEDVEFVIKEPEADAEVKGMWADD